jgi:hypothetical protein
MWQHKQEERELKRSEGDIIKNQRSVRHMLRDYENGKMFIFSKNSFETSACMYHCLYSICAHHICELFLIIKWKIPLQKEGDFKFCNN